MFVQAQIANFGQVPSQLFAAPHPQRMTFEAAVAAKWSQAMASAIIAVRSSGVRRRVYSTAHTAPIVLLLFTRGKSGAVSVDLAGSVASHKCVHASCLLMLFLLLFLPLLSLLFLLLLR
jgi:hypothetical protein